MICRPTHCEVGGADGLFVRRWTCRAVYSEADVWFSSWYTTAIASEGVFVNAGRGTYSEGGSALRCVADL